MLHEKARIHITGLANDDLAEYIRGGTDLYQEEALEFARKELARRSLAPELVKEIDNEASHRVAFRNLSDQALASCPLGLVEKIIAFLSGIFWIGLIYVVMASLRFGNRGESRKVTDLWKWCGIGFLSRLLMALATNR